MPRKMITKSEFISHIGYLKDQVASIDGDTEVDDYKSILQDVVQGLDMVEGLQMYSSAAAAASKGFRDDGAADVIKNMFPALARRDNARLEELGFKAGGFSEKDEGWKVGKKPAGAEKAALGTVLTGDSVSGSYLVGESYYNEVMRISSQASTMMGRVTKMNMPELVLKVPQLTTNVSLAWPTDQSSAKTESAPTFELETLTAKTCAAWLTITDEFEEDSIVALGQFFTRLYSEAWGLEFDKQVLTANADPFTGILYDTDVNDVSMGSGNTTFSNVTIDHLVDMQDAVTGGEMAHVGAMYIMHRSIFNELRKLKDDNGNPIYQRGDATTPPTIMSTPYVLSDAMPKLTDSAVSTPFIIYGNPRYWLWGDRVGVEVRRFDSTVRAVDYDQIFFRFRTRASFAPGVPSAFSRLVTAAE